MSDLLLHHVTNKHHWPGYNSFKKCAHKRLTEARKVKWINPGSKAYNELKKIMTKANLKKDLMQIHGAVHTTLLEVNSVHPKSKVTDSK